MRAAQSSLKGLITGGIGAVKSVGLGLMEAQRTESVKKAFGLRLREIRGSRGFSQERLALLCGLDRSYVGDVERGERNVSLVNIWKFADALAIPAAALLQEPDGTDDFTLVGFSGLSDANRRLLEELAWALRGKKPEDASGSG